MLFEFKFEQGHHERSDASTIKVGTQTLRLRFARHRRARRYVLRLDSDGAVRVTIPRRGNQVEARRFAERNENWLQRHLLGYATNAARDKAWEIGTQIRFRGEWTRIESDLLNPGTGLKLANEHIAFPARNANIRAAIESHLWRLAKKELPKRVQELATLHRLSVRRVTVRNQRSRWGSCSPGSVISLNWRLIQVPSHVCDYIILHELAHIKEMNHSPKFWAEVAKLCPGYEAAEAWLKQNSVLQYASRFAH